MSRSKEIAKERLSPAKELYKPPKDNPVRIGATQHTLYKSSYNRVAPVSSSEYPGKWSANLNENL